METFVKYVIGGIGVVGLIVVLAILFAYPTMWFVNYLIAPHILVSLFGIPQLTLWKALALNFLAGLFKCTTTVNNKNK